MIQNVKKFTVEGLGGQLVSGDLEEKCGIPVKMCIRDSLRRLRPVRGEMSGVPEYREGRCV